MHMTYKTMLKGAARIALSCLTLLGAMLPVACVYEQIPEAYDEADTYIHLNLNATTGLHTFTMKLPRMTGGTPLKKIDLYILANAGMSSHYLTYLRETDKEVPWMPRRGLLPRFSSI